MTFKYIIQTQKQELRVKRLEEEGYQTIFQRIREGKANIKEGLDRYRIGKILLITDTSELEMRPCEDSQMVVDEERDYKAYAIIHKITITGSKIKPIVVRGYKFSFRDNTEEVVMLKNEIVITDTTTFEICMY